MKTPPLAPPARRANNRFGTLVVLALAPSMVILGWRALLVVLGVVLAWTIADRMLRAPRLNVRRWPVVLPVEALLLAGLLPAELAGGTTSASWLGDLWPLIPAAGLALALTRRAHELLPAPAWDGLIVVAVALHLLIGSTGLSPRAALQRGTIVTGDVLDVSQVSTAIDPWFKRPTTPAAPALQLPWAADQLGDYLDPAARRVEIGGANLDRLVRDRLPPLEDLVLLGHPMPIGMTSGIVLLGAILWGAYRRTIDYRIPLIALGVAYVTLVLMPVPTSITDRGASYRFLALLQPDIGVATALTFVHYLLFASPLFYCVGLLATRGHVRPMQPLAIVMWSALLGFSSAIAMLYFSVTSGPLWVLLVAPQVGRWLDRWLARRPLELPD